MRLSAATGSHYLRLSADSLRRAHIRETETFRLSAINRCWARCLGSQCQARGPHAIGQFAGSGGIELAVEEAPNLGGSGIELVGQNLGRVALSREAGFQIVELGR